MKKERLSKLQKWILKICYERSLESYGASRSELLLGFFGKKDPAKEASLSRSLWLLLEREYIAGLSPMRVQNMAMIYGVQGKSVEDFEKDYGNMKLSEKVATPSIRKLNKIKIIIITDKGKEKAKELLKVK